MATLFDTGIFSIEGLAGEILVGAKLSFYEAGTSTPLATYADIGLTVPNSNPVVADAAGRFGPIWLQSALYKVVLTSFLGVVLVTRDNIGNTISGPGGGAAVGFSYDQTYPTATLGAAIDGSTINGAFYGIQASVLVDDSPAVLAAMTVANLMGRVLVLPAGDIYLSNWTQPTFSNTVRITGAGRQLTVLHGATDKAFVKLNPGGTFSAHDCGWDTWEAACKLIDNTGLSAFELLEIDHCYFNNIAYSPVTDWDTYDATGGIKEFRAVSCLVTNAATTTVGSTNHGRGGIRLDSAYIYSAYVAFNEIRGVGSPSVDKQRVAIYLGGASFLLNGTYLVVGNRIEGVWSNAASPGGGTGHLSGITCLGAHARIIDNYIDDVKAYNVGNTDNYAIYVKSSYQQITGNTCRNAGGSQAVIMCKGSPNTSAPDLVISSLDYEKVIAHNVIQRDTAFPQDLQTVGIVCYNAGVNIHDNNISGLHYGIATIQPIYAGVDRINIHHNNIHGLRGTAGYNNCVAIQIPCPSNVLIESNIITDIGAGTETTSYAISFLNNALAGNYGQGTIRGNQIIGVAASVTSSARGINWVFDNAGATSYVDATIEDNLIVNVGRGLNLSINGTATGIFINRNHLRGCSSAFIINSGALTAFDGTVDGNSFDSKPYISSSSATPAVFCVNQLRVTGTPTVTNFTGGIDGQLLIVKVPTGATISHNANIILAGAANWTPASGGRLTLERDGTEWREVSRAAY